MYPLLTNPSRSHSRCIGMFDWLVEVNSLPALTIELRRAHQRGRESAAAKVGMHDQQPHEKLIEETFVRR